MLDPQAALPGGGHWSRRGRLKGIPRYLPVPIFSVERSSRRGDDAGGRAGVGAAPTAITFAIVAADMTTLVHCSDLAIRCVPALSPGQGVSPAPPACRAPPQCVHARGSRASVCESRLPRQLCPELVRLTRPVAGGEPIGVSRPRPKNGAGTDRFGLIANAEADPPSITPASLFKRVARYYGRCAKIRAN